MQQSAEFYVNEDGPEYVWHGEKYSVIRNGEMRIEYKGETIRYSNDLIDAGITTDGELDVLRNMDAIGENPWFEIVETEGEWEWDPDNYYETLNDAIESAKAMEGN